MTMSAPRRRVGSRLLVLPFLTIALAALDGGSLCAQPQPFAFPPPPTAQPVPTLRAGEGAILPTARFGRDSPVITGGLHWRVYADKPDQSGGFRLLKEDRTAQPTFILPPGGYIVHVAFG